jgi:hypothetical protein
MHADWRRPQLVRQVDTDDRSRLFLQAAMQTFSSPLQRIGAEKTGTVESRAGPVAIAISAAVSRRGRLSRESNCRIMPMS